MSYVQSLYHVVIRTKYSEMTLSESHERDLYKYIWGFVQNKKSSLFRINGMPDHIHMIISLAADIAVSDFIRDLKVSTHKWLENNKDFPDFQGWGERYAAFSCGKDDVPGIIEYIKKQKEHHKTISFADEYRNFILRNGGKIDEKYFLKD